MPCRMHLSHEARLTYADTPRFKLRPLKLIIQPVLETGALDRCWKPVPLLRLSCSLRQCQVSEKVRGRPLQSGGGYQLLQGTLSGRVLWQDGGGVGVG